METNIPQRWHVSTICGRRVINAIAFNNLATAQNYAAHQKHELKEHNSRLAEGWANQLREELFDTDSSTDHTPTLAPPQIFYTYRVEPCPHGQRCVACAEAGLIEL